MSPENIVKRLNILISEKANWDSYHQDVANIYMPRKAFITRPRVFGERLDFSRVFDNSPIRALNTLASGFHSWLTNPASPWFAIAMTERQLMELKEVKVWLEDVEEEIRFTFNMSNLDETLQEFYIDSGGFGTGNVFSQEDFKTRVHFTELPIQEVYIEEDTRGRVIRLYRKFEYRVQQAWDLWGNNAGKEVVEKMKNPKNQSDKVIYVHYIGARDIREVGKKDKLNMPFESKWITFKDKELVAEGGFREFPLASGRFHKNTNEVWGFSPCMENLDDAHMLNSMKRVTIRSAMKKVDPPFTAPSRGFILPFNFNPSGANYRNPQTAADALQMIDTKGDIGIGLEMIQDTRESINLGLFVRLFQAFGPERRDMTATEVNARIREGMALLGPVVGRFQQEVLDPIILRTFNILFRNGLLPPVPRVLEGRDFQIKYISPLARAQREGEVGGILDMLATVGEMAKFDPRVIDKINPDKAVDILADIRGIPSTMINDDEQTSAIRSARAEQEAQAISAEQLKGGASAVKDIAKAERDLQEASK